MQGKANPSAIQTMAPLLAEKRISMEIVTLIAGLVLLALAGDALVRGSVAAAQRMNIPPIIIGLTIVAFGTSAPEFVVSLVSSVKDNSMIAVGKIGRAHV